MTGPESLKNLRIVLASLIGVGDQQGDGRAGGEPFINARENLNLIAFLALGDEAARSRATPVQIGLYVLLTQSHPRWATIDDATNGFAVDSPKLVTVNE